MLFLLTYCGSHFVQVSDMPRKFVWTNAQDAQIRRLRVEGGSWDSIAAILGLTRWTVIERGRRIGAQRPPREFVLPPGRPSARSTAGRTSAQLGCDQCRHRPAGRALSSANLPALNPVKGTIDEHGQGYGGAAVRRGAADLPPGGGRRRLACSARDRVVHQAAQFVARDCAVRDRELWLDHQAHTAACPFGRADHQDG